MRAAYLAQYIGCPLFGVAILACILFLFSIYAKEKAAASSPASAPAGVELTQTQRNHNEVAVDVGSAATAANGGAAGTHYKIVKAGGVAVTHTNIVV